jgi:hypothetical protein
MATSQLARTMKRRIRSPYSAPRDIDYGPFNLSHLQVVGDHPTGVTGFYMVPPKRDGLAGLTQASSHANHHTTERST